MQLTTAELAALNDGQSITISPPTPLTLLTTDFDAATLGTTYSDTIAVVGGSPPYTAEYSGLPSGLTGDGDTVTGTPTAVGTSTVIVTVTDSAQNSVVGKIPLGVTGIARPSVNPSTGHFVANGQWCDANGVPFLAAGVNRCHYDSSSSPGIAKSGANVVRFECYLTSVGVSTYINVMQQHLANKQVVIPTMFYFPDGTQTSGNQSPTELVAAMGWWTANAAALNQGLGKNWVLNPVNEWGPGNSTVWRDGWVASIPVLRAAEIQVPILIDTGGYGQDLPGLEAYAAAIVAADPLKSIIFGYHAYGSIQTSTDLANLIAGLTSVSKKTGAAVLISEFGPGKNIGPSPTMITPDQIMGAAQTAGIGCLGWAWDNNNLGAGKSDDTGFSMTYAGPGIYTQASDLTLYGTDIVAQLAKYAKPATSF